MGVTSWWAGTLDGVFYDAEVHWDQVDGELRLGYAEVITERDGVQEFHDADALCRCNPRLWRAIVSAADDNLYKD